MRSKKAAKKPAKLKTDMKKAISIQLDISLLQQLDKRAKKNYLSLREQIEDILRRSMISYLKNKKQGYSDVEVEKMIKIFSRKKSGRKTKK